MKSKSVFVSHAAKNKELADKLVDLLETGIGISSKDIFCSSLEGMGIPSGSNFIEFIKKQIAEPKIVIMILTQQYYKSEFCLCELGASWILSHKIIPLLVKPLEYNNIKAVLTGVHLLKIEEKNDLNQMQQELVEALKINPNVFARWEIKRDNFLGKISGLMSPNLTDDMIDIKEFNIMKKNYIESVDELKKLEKEINKKDDIIEKLKKAKNQDDVTSIIEENSDDIQKFDNILNSVKKSLKKLSSIVIEALYYNQRGELLQWSGDGYDRSESIQEAIEKDYLREVEEGIEIVSDDPKISESLKKLSELESFVENLEDNIEFNDYYTHKYNQRLKFTSRRFWDTHLT